MPEDLIDHVFVRPPPLRFPFIPIYFLSLPEAPLLAIFAYLAIPDLLHSRRVGVIIGGLLITKA